jgi:hypothetical protein
MDTRKRVTFTNHTDRARDVSCDVCKLTRPYWRARILQLPAVTIVRERPHETFRYILTDRGYRDVSTGVFHPEAGGTWPYGDWDHDVSPADATHVLINYTGYSDYSGGGVDRSNNRSLLRNYPEAFTQAYGGHGTEELMLSVDYYAPADPESHDSRADRTDYLLQAIAGLADYPLYDEEDYSALENEEADEAWDQFLSSDVPSRLRDASPSAEAMDDAIEALDELAAKHSWESTRPDFACECGWVPPMPLTEHYREQALYRHVNQYPSLRDLFYESLRDQNESPYLESATSIVFPCMAESIEWIADRIWELRAADNPQVPAWFNPAQTRLPGMPVKREDI